MTNQRRCENCDKPMLPFVLRQRFCCRECSDQWFQLERQQAVKAFRENGGVVETRRMKAAGAPT
jgi:hypothetical protein